MFEKETSPGGTHDKYQNLMSYNKIFKQHTIKNNAMHSIQGIGKRKEKKSNNLNDKVIVNQIRKKLK